MEERTTMRKTRISQLAVAGFFLVLVGLASVCFGDTFTNKATGEELHGYVTGQTEGSETIVQTLEKGEIKLILGEWDVIADRNGRNNKVIVMTLDVGIMYEIETAAIEKAIAEASAEGPLCIVFELDTPGGRTDFAQRICTVLSRSRGCEVVCFVKGGNAGGALSAGTAVAFSCDKIYMANNTVIGAATVVTMQKGSIAGMKKTYGEEVGEKISSAWRAYLASLAEQHGRPGVLARAMVDKEIEVVEVAGVDGSLFVEPVNRKTQQEVIHTWSTKGSLLTLTAEEAVKCGIADKILNSRQEVLGELGVSGAEIVIDDTLPKAQKELRQVTLKFNRLRKSLDLEIKGLQQAKHLSHALKQFRAIKRDFKHLIKLAKNYPDLGLNVEVLEEELNSVEAYYKSAKMNARRRR